MNVKPSNTFDWWRCLLWQLNRNANRMLIEYYLNIPIWDYKAKIYLLMFQLSHLWPLTGLIVECLSIKIVGKKECLTSFIFWPAIGHRFYTLPQYLPTKSWKDQNTIKNNNTDHSTWTSHHPIPVASCPFKMSTTGRTLAYCLWF